VQKGFRKYLATSDSQQLAIVLTEMGPRIFIVLFHFLFQEWIVGVKKDSLPLFLVSLPHFTVQSIKLHSTSC